MLFYNCYYTICLLLLVFPTLLFAQQSNMPRIHLIPAEDEVRVLINGQHVTSYLINEELKKPVFYPVNTVEGITVCRGWPLDPRPRERVDHRHHVGIWFNHGDVNGLDFWNNSSDRREDQQHRYGSIEHVRISSLRSGDEMGSLTAEIIWKAPAGSELMREQKQCSFSVAEGGWIMDHSSTLTALVDEVKFEDTKEGMFGIRVTRELELVEEKAQRLTDAHGIARKEPVLDNTGVSGNYQTSNGQEGNEAWGTRNEWVRLSGKINGSSVSVIMFDHPENFGFPAFWHARGYGLFAMNHIGRQKYQRDLEPVELVLKKGESLTLRHRVFIHQGKLPTDEALKKVFKEFATND